MEGGMEEGWTVAQKVVKLAGGGGQTRVSRRSCINSAVIRHCLQEIEWEDPALTGALMLGRGCARDEGVVWEPVEGMLHVIQMIVASGDERSRSQKTMIADNQRRDARHSVRRKHARKHRSFLQRRSCLLSACRPITSPERRRTTSTVKPNHYSYATAYFCGLRLRRIWNFVATTSVRKLSYCGKTAWGRANDKIRIVEE